LQDDFEQELARLDDRIHRTEVRIAESALQQRKVTALVTTYSLVLYLLWLGSFFFVLWPRVRVEEDGWVAVMREALPLVLGPIAVWLLRRLVQAYYRRQLVMLEQEVESLRKKQKLKIEEVPPSWVF
jgi:hypothetical protein